MNHDQELLLRRWLDSRDPGPARARLREAVEAVPFTERPARFPSLDLTLRAGFGLAPIARPLVIAMLVLLALAALTGAVLFQPWRPFPPKGLLAYTAPIAASGSTGITLIGADGRDRRQVSPTVAHLFDHSPRWSPDGRTLLFARTSGLDAFGACVGTGSVVIYDVATATERVVATGLRPMNVIEWSPSGDRAAFTYPPPGCGADAVLGIVDLRTGEVTSTVVAQYGASPSPIAGGALWHVEWAGEVPSAVREALVTENGPDFTVTIDVPSHDGSARIRYSWSTPERMPTLVALGGSLAADIDLGPGGLPAWSPDDSAIAFIEPGGPAGPDAVDYRRDRLVVASAGTWQRRELADVLVLDGPPADLIPAVRWTGDGSAVFWIDPLGVHVVDVVTGRATDLLAIPDTCTDIAWQPTPG